MSSGAFALENNTQSEKQRFSMSPLNGYRKPIKEGDKTWCNCSIPVLINSYHGYGQASCLRCGHAWYN